MFKQKLKNPFKQESQGQNQAHTYPLTLSIQ